MDLGDRIRKITHTFQRNLGLEGMSYEEGLRILGLSSFGERKVIGYLIAFHSFLRSGSREEASSGYPATEYGVIVQSCTRVGLNWTFRSISLLGR